VSAVSSARPRLLDVAPRLAPVAGLVAVLVAAAITTPDLFSRPNVTNILFLAGLIGVTAIGQTLVLLTGGIDLSVGAVVGLTTVIVATQTDGRDAALPQAILLALLAALVVGAVNAGLVLLRDVPPFVATFATFVLVQGAITAWTRGAPSGTIPGALRPLGTERILGMPAPVWVFALLAVIAGVVLARTTVGRRLYATGANPRAAALSGIRTGRIIASAYVIAALLAALGGLINAGYVGYVDAQLSRSLNLDSIAAAVIGGVALTGGQGTIAQTASGVALLAVLLVWMLQLGAGAGGQLSVEGAAILLAVWLQRRGSARLTNSPQGGGR
jgi:ribose/xylose/arabinose/galactoside ABC-type transport system permease subunit